MDTTRQLGRLAGLIYLFMGIAGAFSIMYVPGALFVRDDPQQTFQNISANLSLLQLGVASGLLHKALFVCLPIVLFAIFERHGRLLAGLMVAFVLISVPLYYAATSHLYEIVALLRDGGRSDAYTVMNLVDNYGLRLEMTSLFWGLWLLPFGMLVLKSGAIPRLIGLLLLVGGLGYTANFFGPLIVPQLYRGEALAQIVASVSAIGECAAILWLLIMGARPPQAGDDAEVIV